jgi:hypothetical protein
VRAGAGAKVSGYDIYRAEDGGIERIVEAVKGNHFTDRRVLGGLAYRYYVRAYDGGGRMSGPSNVVTVAVPMPNYDNQGEIAHARSGGSAVGASR